MKSGLQVMGERWVKERYGDARMEMCIRIARQNLTDALMELDRGEEVRVSEITKHLGKALLCIEGTLSSVGVGDMTLCDDLVGES